MSYLGLPLFSFQRGGQANSSSKVNSKAKKNTKLSDLLITNQDRRSNGFPEESRLLREEIRRLYKEKFNENIVSMCQIDDSIICRLFNHLNSRNLVIDFIQNDYALGPNATLEDILEIFEPINPDTQEEPIPLYLQEIFNSAKPSIESYEDPTNNINNLLIASINAEQGTRIKFDENDFPIEAELQEIMEDFSPIPEPIVEDMLPEDFFPTNQLVNIPVMKEMEPVNDELTQYTMARSLDAPPIDYETVSIEDLLGSDQCLFSNNYQVIQSCNANNYCMGNTGPFIEQSIESPELLAGNMENCIIPQVKTDCPKCSWTMYSGNIDDGLNLPHLNMDQFALSENSYNLLTEIKNNLNPQIGENEKAGEINKSVIDRHITSNGGIAPYVAEILINYSTDDFKLSDAVKAISSILVEESTLSNIELKNRLIEAYTADALQANSEEIFMPKGIGIMSILSSFSTITISLSVGCLLIILFLAGMAILGYMRGKKQRPTGASYSNAVAQKTASTGGLAQKTAVAGGV